MKTVSQAAQDLGVTRDKLHYLIKKKLIQPHREGKHFLLTDEDIQKVRRHLQVKTKPSAAIIRLRVTGPQVREAVDKLKNGFHEVVWVAGAWGNASIIAFLEAAKLENIASAPFRFRTHLDCSNDSTTYIIPSEHYHVKEILPVENERLAVVLIELAKDSNYSVIPVMKGLSKIKEVRRYGAILGPWDAFAEVRYQDVEQDTDALYSIVMEQIHEIKCVLNTTTILTMRNLRREREGFQPQASHKK
jgi:excisionase family DNA binding protein